MTVRPDFVEFAKKRFIIFDAPKLVNVTFILF